MTPEKRALEIWGTTDNLEFATWMLADGTLVNGTIEGNQRDVEHAEIYRVYPMDPNHDGIIPYPEYINRFMNRGNIRVACTRGYCLFLLHTPPTQWQLNVLLDQLQHAIEHSWEISFIQTSRRGRTKTYDSLVQWLSEYVFAYTDCHLPESGDILRCYMDYLPDLMEAY